jgi:hypothetical protein
MSGVPMSLMETASQQIKDDDIIAIMPLRNAWDQAKHA